jgi:hypothetical protein
MTFKRHFQKLFARALMENAKGKRQRCQAATHQPCKPNKALTLQPTKTPNKRNLGIPKRKNTNKTPKIADTQPSKSAKNLIRS